jgi:hypothetical protein
MVTVQPLRVDSADGLGILPPAVTGLPRNLWGTDDLANIAALMTQDNSQDLPALQSQLLTLLLAISDPPLGPPAGEALFLARVDKLLAIGALDQARALLDTAGAARSPEIFRRYFDVALLIDDEDRACQSLKTAPGLAPALPTRIFCLARAGDFDLFLLAGRYTLLEQDPLETFLPLCEQRGIGILCGGPYNSGILATGAREGAVYNYVLAPPSVVERVRKIEAVCAAHLVSLPCAALQFPLAHQAIVSVIPGGKTADEVRRNAAQLEVAIPPAFWADLKTAGLIAAHAPVPA